MITPSRKGRGLVSDSGGEELGFFRPWLNRSDAALCAN